MTCEHGLTPDEIKVSDLICDAFNAYNKLPSYHPSEMAEVVDAVHRWQAVLMSRVVRRTNPEVFPIKS